jgi:hypothetical protein
LPRKWVETTEEFKLRIAVMLRSLRKSPAAYFVGAEDASA